MRFSQINTVIEGNHLWKCLTTSSKANDTLMCGKIKVLRSDLRKIRNDSIKLMFQSNCASSATPQCCWARRVDT